MPSRRAVSVLTPAGLVVGFWISWRSRSSRISGSLISPLGTASVLSGRAPAQDRRQRGDVDLVALGEHQRLLDDVLQLAHVAGPADRWQAAPARRRRCRSRAGLVRLPSLSMKWATRRGMSSLRSRSGGTTQRHDVQPVEQILAEAALGDLGLDVAVGRRDDAHVDLDGLLAAHALELALLQHAQQLELQGRA